MKRTIMAVGLGIMVFGAAYGANAAEVSVISKPEPTKAAPVVRESSYDPNLDFNRFTKDLTLTDEQQASIKPILTELEKELLPLKKLTFQRLGTRGAPIVQKYYDQIREQLKSEQRDIFNDLTGKGIITPFVR